MPRYIIEATETWEIEARSEDIAYENYQLGKLRDVSTACVEVLDNGSYQL